MKMDKKILHKFLLLCGFMTLTACSFNPFLSNNRTTGNPAAAAVGAGVGIGAVGLLGGTKPLMFLGGVTGGALGYYLTTLRNEASGIYEGGGEVYKVGDYIGIYIPTDNLFAPNTAEFIAGYNYILDSVAAVLGRYPNNNILISGNTSGFARPRWEKKLSLARARQVAFYLWNAGVSNFRNQSIDTRKLDYVGYGDYFPIAGDHTNKGIRENSRIQITSYPSDADLHLDKRHLALHNIGSLDDDVGKAVPTPPCESYDSNGTCNKI